MKRGLDMKNTRIATLVDELKDNKLDAMVISSYASYRYFSGFSGSNCILIITQSRRLLLTDGRYTEQAKLQAPNFEILVCTRTICAVMIDLLRETQATKVGYETMKVTDFEIKQWRTMANEIEWIPQMDFGKLARVCKDKVEIACITRAVAIADQALSEILPSIKIGMSEREVAALLEYHMMKNGSEHPAFDTIVVSGARGALPHGMPTDKKIERGDMITIDFGACFEGYMSDITRTIWMDIPSEQSQHIFNTVYEAQQTCIQAVRPDVPVSDLDALQRKVFEKYNLQEFIAHSLGHGVGLEIHESPSLSMSGTTLLKPGMVITIEPGLYIPGLCGVRIEDTVLVTEDGAHVLTKSPHKIKICK